GEAYDLLRTARQLAGTSASAGLRMNLLLAAWFKKPRDTELEKALIADLVKDEATLKTMLSEPDRIRLWVLHAQTREKAERMAALDSYLKALEAVREVLRKKEADPLVAEYFYKEVVTPASVDDGKALLGEEPPEAVRDRYARLCGEIARLLKDSLD